MNLHFLLGVPGNSRWPGRLSGPGRDPALRYDNFLCLATRRTQENQIRWFWLQIWGILKLVWDHAHVTPFLLRIHGGIVANPQPTVFWSRSVGFVSSETLINLLLVSYSAKLSVETFRRSSAVLPPAFQVDPVNFRTERWGNLQKIKNPNPIFQSNWWCRLSRECGIADWSHGGRRQRIELVLHAKLRMHLLISIRSVASWSWASATSNGSKIKRFEPGFLRMWILKLHDFMGH